MFLTLSEKFYDVKVNRLCPHLRCTLVRTSWFSWIKLLVSRKCATQLITILWPVPDHWCYQWSGVVGPCSKQSSGLEAILLPVLINNFFSPQNWMWDLWRSELLDATQDPCHWEKWPSDAADGWKARSGSSGNLSSIIDALQMSHTLWSEMY